MNYANLEKNYDPKPYHNSKVNTVEIYSLRVIFPYGRLYGSIPIGVGGRGGIFAAGEIVPLTPVNASLPMAAPVFSTRKKVPDEPLFL